MLWREKNMETETLTLIEVSILGATTWIFLGDSCIITQDDEHKNIYCSICHYYKMLEHFKFPKTGD